MNAIRDVLNALSWLTFEVVFTPFNWHGITGHTHRDDLTTSAYLRAGPLAIEVSW